MGFFFFVTLILFYIKKKKVNKNYGSQSNKVGFFFVDTDHLGSTSTFTDAYGKLVTGGEFSGASDINYLPYGEIDAKNSSGPDLSRYKFTGQKEDENTNMLFYKARYYDPELGRFLQADSKTFPDQMNGLNQYMYVNGNPTNLVDPDGNRSCVIGEGYLPIWGNYTGPGACRKTKMLKSWVSIRLYIYASLLLINDPDKSIRDLALLVLLITYYLQYMRPMTPLTEVDKDSQVHDRDAGQFWHTPQANNAWIRGATSKFRGGLTPIPTDRMYNNTHDREYQATSKRYGVFRSPIAWGSTAAVILGDWAVTVIGTTLFTSVNQLNYLGDSIKKTKNLNNSLYRKFSSNRSIELEELKFNNSTALFNQQLAKVSSLFKNAFKISKWSL